MYKLKCQKLVIGIRKFTIMTIAATISGDASGDISLGIGDFVVGNLMGTEEFSSEIVSTPVTVKRTVEGVEVESVSTSEQNTTATSEVNSTIDSEDDGTISNTNENNTEEGNGSSSTGQSVSENSEMEDNLENQNTESVTTNSEESQDAESYTDISLGNQSNDFDSVSVFDNEETALESEKNNTVIIVVGIIVLIGLIAGSVYIINKKIKK